MKTIGCKIEDSKYKVLQDLLEKEKINQSELLQKLVNKAIEQFLQGLSIVNQVSESKIEKNKDLENGKGKMVNQAVLGEFKSVEEISKNEMVNQNISEELKKIFEYVTDFKITLRDWLIRYVKERNIIPKIEIIKVMNKKLTDAEVDLIIKYFTEKGYQLEA